MCGRVGGPFARALETHNSATVSSVRAERKRADGAEIVDMPFAWGYIVRLNKVG